MKICATGEKFFKFFFELFKPTPFTDPPPPLINKISERKNMFHGSIDEILAYLKNCHFLGIILALFGKIHEGGAFLRILHVVLLENVIDP